MTDITQESLQKKQEAIDLLTRRYRGMEQRTEDIDLRLRLYFEDLLEHSLRHPEPALIRPWLSPHTRRDLPTPARAEGNAERRYPGRKGAHEKWQTE